MPFWDRGAAALFVVAVAFTRLHDNIACCDEDDKAVLFKRLKRPQNAAAQKKTIKGNKEFRKTL